MNILNLTQHQATQEQQEAGVVEPTNKKAVQKALTFNCLPSNSAINGAVNRLVMVAEEHAAKIVMVGGAPYLMGPLTAKLKEFGIKPLFAYSERVSEEHTNEEGEVVKINKFVHKGWVHG